jgi:PhnB protein
MSKPDPIPKGIHTVTPHIVCDGAAAAIDFYKKAFNAEELMRLPGKDGMLMHGAIRIGDSVVMLADENPEWKSFGPKTLKGSSVTLHLYVEDADRQFKQAVEAGCTVYMSMADMFWGDRYGIVQDPYGHVWSIATHIRDVSPEELQAFAGADCN